MHRFSSWQWWRFCRHCFAALPGPTMPWRRRTKNRLGRFSRRIAWVVTTADDDSKGGLSVVSYKSLMEGGDGGEVIVAGKSDESRLVKMLLGTAKPKMPPKDSKQPKPEEIAARQTLGRSGRQRAGLAGAAVGRRA